MTTTAVRPRQPRHLAPPRLSATVTTLLHSVGARILVLPVSAILGIFSTRLIIDHYGQAAYGQYGLLVGIGSLIPFADLGITAAIMNAVGQSADPANDPTVHRVLVTSMRILSGSTLVVISASVLLTVFGAWPGVLGEGLLEHSGPLAAGLCLAVIGITLLVGFGQQLLAGLGKNHLAIILLGLQTPVVLSALFVIIHFDAGLGAYIAVVPYLATFLLAGVALYTASRKVSPAIRLALRDAPKVRTVQGGHVFGLAWPMLIQMIALPLAMQTDRLVLSHVSDVKDLAQYNLASQMYTPIWQVVSAAGFALWPIFARSRADRSAEAPSPTRLAAFFGGGGVLLCILITSVSPWLSARASGGTIHLSLTLIISFSVLMIFQSTKAPLGMYMTDERGLRFQAYMIVLLLPVNLALSWYLALRIGAAGPVIGSAVGVFGCQVLANWIYVRRDLRRRAVASALLP